MKKKQKERVGAKLPATVDRTISHGAKQFSFFCTFSGFHCFFVSKVVSNVFITVSTPCALHPSLSLSADDLALLSVVVVLAHAVGVAHVVGMVVPVVGPRGRGCGGSRSAEEASRPDPDPGRVNDDHVIILYDGLLLLSARGSLCGRTWHFLRVLYYVTTTSKSALTHTRCRTRRIPGGLKRRLVVMTLWPHDIVPSALRRDRSQHGTAWRGANRKTPTAKAGSACVSYSAKV